MKADVNKKTDDGMWSPLKIAAFRGFADAVRTLVALKANVGSIRAAKGVATLSPAVRTILNEAESSAPAS
jgi:hypothetical protein